MTKTALIRCPKCEEPIHAAIWAKACDKSRMALSLTPAPGEFMSVRTVGGSLSCLDKLLKAVGREIGVKTIPFVERIETTGDGELQFHLLITNVKPKGTKP